MFLPSDRDTGRPRGFAFVEFTTEAEAAAAIQQFDGQELDGRPLRVNSAEDRPRRPRGGPSFGAPYGGEPFFGGGGKPPKSKGSRRGLRARKRGG